MVEKPPTPWLEITVLTAEGLQLSHRPIKKNAFVIVRSDPNMHGTTSLDKEGGSHPCWNEKLRLALPHSARSIAVEVHCETAFGVKMVGMANIPVSDFYGGVLPVDYLHFLSYRLREPNGERNGIINLSVRMHAPQRYYVHRPQSTLCGENVGGGVAVGIPVPFGYRV